MNDKVDEKIETVEGAVESIAPLKQEVTAQLYAGDPLLAMIERAAYRPDFNPEVMKMFLEERRRIMDDMRRMEFNAAFAKAQRLFKPAKKNRVIDVPGKDGKKGQHTPYADWMAQWASAQEPCTENGLSLWQEIKASPGQPVTVISHLEHSGGWHRQVEITFPHDPSGSKNAVQGEVSAVTYGRRVTGMAILNLTAEDDPADDDGVAAGRTIEAVAVVSDEQLAALGEKMKAANVPESAICTNCKIDTLADLPAAEFDGVMKRLDVTIKRKQQEPAL